MDAGRKKEISQLVKEKAHELGFDLCGIARVRRLTECEPVLSRWLGSGMNGEMDFLSRDTEKRLDPSRLFPGARSVVVTGINYYNERKQHSDVPVIARYACGIDYHYVIPPRLNQLLKYVRDAEPSAKGKIFVDSGQMLEKAWAVEAGLGWQGKNSLIVNTRSGSFFFIGIILLDIELEYENPYMADHCGECRLCLDACPTAAINGNRTIDARKCISYHTIENKGEIPEDLSGNFRGRVYGCDICQEACPWNKNAKPGTVPEFSSHGGFENLTKEEWRSLAPGQFENYFGKTPVKRIKYKRLIRNIEIAFKSMQTKKG